jgi:SAM-dependent methyltransferase
MPAAGEGDARGTMDEAEASIGRHDAEIQQNAERWWRKPLLRRAYAGVYREIAARLEGLPEGLLVECGSGIGKIKEVLPRCLTTDLFPNPWLDRTENVYALSFPGASVAGLILFDVFHHLEHPGRAIREIERVLVPGGRAVIFEPAMGLLGRAVLGLFHPEPLGLRRPIVWDPPAGWQPAGCRYHAAQGNAWRVFRRGEHADRLAPLAVREVACFTAIPWILSGGFSGPQLCPAGLFPALHRLDRWTSRLPAVFASRMLVVLEKPPG